MQEDLIFAAIPPESLEYFADLLSAACGDVLVSCCAAYAGQDFVSFLEEYLHGREFCPGQAFSPANDTVEIQHAGEQRQQGGFRIFVHLRAALNDHKSPEIFRWSQQP